MREYAKVAPTFWTGTTGKALKKRGQEAVIVAMYLMTSPHANMIGVYHCPIGYIVIDTGLDMEGASKGLRCSIEVGFCTYDDESDYVFVHEFAAYQIGASLGTDDKRCKGIENELLKLPRGLCGRAFAEKYRLAFRIPEEVVLAFIAEAPSKPLRSQEQEQATKQEQAQAQDQAQAKNLFGDTTATKPAATRVARAPKVKLDAPSGASTWNAYSTAYADRYGAEPVRNAKVNALVAKFVQRLGIDDAPRVAAFYVGHNSQLYVRATHALDLLLRDAEGLRTQWAQGRQTTNAQAMQADRTQANASAFGPLIAAAREREAQGAE